MPSEGANLYPIAYGDFKRAYTLVDRISMEMLRDRKSPAPTRSIPTTPRTGARPCSPRPGPRRW